MTTEPTLLQYSSGRVTRFFYFVFHESKPSGPLINMLIGFLLKIRFHGYIREISDSAQANTVRSQILRKANTARSQTPRRLALRGVLPGPIVSFSFPLIEKIKK